MNGKGGCFLNLCLQRMSALTLWIGPEPIWFLMIALKLTLTLGVNDTIQINVFLPRVKAIVHDSVNAVDVQCEHGLRFSFSKMFL